MQAPGQSRGFTLIELVIVTLILGVLGGLTALVLLRPVTAFQDVSRRAELVAEADLAAQQLIREIRQAVPNSVRTSADAQTLELIPSIGGGRYRALPDPSASPPSDILDFGMADTSFDVLGPLLGQAASGDYVVIYNASATEAGANAYRGDNRRLLTGVATNRLTMASTQPLPFASIPSQRFDVVPASGPVLWRCSGNELRRHSGYGFQASIPVAAPNTGDLVLSGMTFCRLRYVAGDSVRNGLALLELTLSRDGETIRLSYQAQTVNAP
jgi:MSHA biogenesis protein MshO